MMVDVSVWRRHLASGLRRWIVPSACLLCHGALERDAERGGPICAGCRAGLPWNDVACPACALPMRGADIHLCARCSAEPPPQDSALSAFRYETPISQAIFGLKYHAQFRQSRWLGEEIARRVAARPAPMPELLIPVPLHASRLRQRGYNQAQELARGITRRLAIPIDAHCAVRTRATADQIGQGAVARHREVRGAFAVDGRVAGLHIALVDDVMTTGSTVNELAKACREAGAARIEVWTAARVA